MNWIKIGSYILIILPTLFAGILITVYLLQDHMIFLGERLPQNHVYNFNLKYEEINFKHSSGHQINALLFTCDKPKGLVYYHHGNAGNLQSWGNLAGSFIRNNYDVLFYDFRGYGKSSDRIKREQHLHDDAKFVLNKFLEGRKYDKLVLHGTSLGSGVASKLAKKVKVDGLILETPYYSFIELIKHHYPFLPATFLSKYKLRTYRYLQKLECPILLFHGTDDEVVPYKNSLDLLKISNHIELVTIKGGIHNNLPDFKKYQLELSNFLSDI